jgi:hypothetical protein
MTNSETPEERRARYLRYAASADEMAFRCREVELRNAYLALAKSWKSLAEEDNLKDPKP